MTKEELKELEYIKSEIEYYTGRKADDDEAREILWFHQQNPRASLDEIIGDYYACEGC